MNPNAARSQFRLAELYYSKGHIGVDKDATREAMKHYQVLAEKTLQRAIELNPQNVSAYSLLGRVYGMWGEHDSAALRFQKALLIAPDDYRTWLLLGQPYLGLQSYDDAIQAFQTAERIQMPTSDKRQLNCYSAHIRSPGTSN